MAEARNKRYFKWYSIQAKIRIKICIWLWGISKKIRRLSKKIGQL